MVEINAFQGYRYNPEKVNIQHAIMPPYDVVDADMKKKLAASWENFVHVNLNESHKKANEILEKWINDKVLVRDNEECLYIYQQVFTINNKEYKRTGFICLLKLEELGNGVLPHEQTFEKHIDERYDLMEKTRSHFGQIFMIYEDKKKYIDKILDKAIKNPEDMGYIDNDECSHRLWKISDNEITSNIINEMKDKKVIIADGHHRYKTSLKYYQNHTDIKDSKYAMVTLVNSFNEGLIILPTNRLIKNFNMNIGNFSPYFDVEKIDAVGDVKIQEKSFILAKKNEFYLLKLKKEDVLDEIFKGEDSVYKNLDVAILHKLIFKKILNISGENIKFIKGNKSTLNSLTKDDVAFLVKPPSLKHIFKITENNKVMPQKSTYFYPKMFSGFVIHKF